MKRFKLLNAKGRSQTCRILIADLACLQRRADLLIPGREANSFHRSKLESLREENHRHHYLAISQMIVECERLRQKIRNVASRNSCGNAGTHRAHLEISEREQQRIGRDFHDGLGQQLHGLSFLAALLEKHLREDGSPRAIEAKQLTQHILDSLELTRSLLHGLQPVESTANGLMAGLNELALHTSKLFKIDCRFDCPTRVLSQRHSMAIHLYRIAQEAVNNAVKHGKPSSIRIKLEAKHPGIIIRVCDNGIGIDEKHRDGHGMGLQIMKYRAKVLNGSLLVKKRRSGGTEVLCSVPQRSLYSPYKGEV